MHHRRFGQRFPGHVIVILFSALLLHHPFTANAQVRPEVSVGLLLGLPSGDFGDNVSDSGIGFVLASGIQLPESPVLLGAEIGYMVYGRDIRSEPFNATTPDLRVDIVNIYGIFQGLFFMRLQPSTSKIRPYVDGLVGFKYLFTQTIAKNASDLVMDWIAYYTNHEDWVLTYGVGVGAAIALWDKGSEFGPVSKGPIGVYFDIGLRYLLGAEAEYLKEGSIQVAGDQVTLLPERSKTDMIHPHFRIRVSF